MPTMRRSPRVLIVALLITGMLLTATAPARAGLTEIFVGATLLFQGLQVVGAFLPDVANLAMNILTLLQTGSQLANSLKGTFDQLGPVLGPGAARRGPPQKPMTLGDVPVIGGPTPAPSPRLPEGPADQAVAGLPSDIEGRVDGLVQSFTSKVALQGVVGQPTSAGPLAVQYSASVSRYDQLRIQIQTQVLDAVSDADAATVDRFAAKVRRLQPADRLAVAPVLKTVVDQGRRFGTLHGNAGQDLLDRLASLKAEVAP